jgi:exopolysaccharide biosynthesis polyprenyl glycosylphosphotransferase
MTKNPFPSYELFKMIDNIIIIVLMLIPTYLILVLFGQGASGFNGNVLRLIIVFFVFFVFIMNLLDGFCFSRYRIHEIIFHSLSAVFITDMICALLLLIFENKTVNLLSIIFVVFFQTIFAVARAFYSNKIYCSLVRSQDTLIICDNKDYALEYLTKISKYKNEFKITGVISPYDANLYEAIKNNAAIHIVGIAEHLRITITEYCYSANKSVYIVPGLYGIMINNSSAIQIDDVLIFKNNNISISSANKFYKRIIDIIISIILLIISSPISLFAVIAIKLNDGGDILFCQERITRDYKKFNLYKLRTMVMDAEKYSGAVLSTINDNRITPLGKFLRSTRIDEIPQLWNVLIGDMSLIGPRPERDVFIKKFVKDCPDFNLRLNVKSGLTGYAQVYGKYNTNPKDKIKMDLFYITNYSLLLDFKILLMTVKTIFTKSSTEGFKTESIRWYSPEMDGLSLIKEKVNVQ